MALSELPECPESLVVQLASIAETPLILTERSFEIIDASLQHKVTGPLLQKLPRMTKSGLGTPIELIDSVRIRKLGPGADSQIRKKTRSVRGFLDPLRDVLRPIRVVEHLLRIVVSGFEGALEEDFDVNPRNQGLPLGSGQAAEASRRVA